ncbi:MAG TPA: type 1 glutamine amidotransferase [Burkholderiales bacterium]|nr:type 1 glutamine amidotransferase [Burkholderiales bacterium]
MKAVAICRFAPTEGPGYFATYLQRNGFDWRLVRLDEGERLPRPGEIAGLAMMGGPMSVNDELRWIPPMLHLIRQAVERDVPVIGHCLGGQLLAKALDARVMRNPVKEIGWGEVSVHDSESAREWSPPRSFMSFHWHGETFAIPAGAVRIWSSAHCENQAYVFGPHIGMQCHIEMTRELLETWCNTGAGEIEDSIGRSPAVQRREQILDDVETKLAALHAVADRVYSRWVLNVRTRRQPR